MAVTQNLNLYLPDDDDYVSNSRDLNDNFEKIDNGFNGYGVTGWTAGSNVQSPTVQRVGNIIFVGFRYDLIDDKELFTNLPKAKFLQRTILASERLRNAGVVQINEGATTLYYIHKQGDTADVKYCQFIYIADD